MSLVVIISLIQAMKEIKLTQTTKVKYNVTYKLYSDQFPKLFGELLIFSEESDALKERLDNHENFLSGLRFLVLRKTVRKI